MVSWDDELRCGHALGSRLLLRVLTAPWGYRARRSSRGWMYGAAAAVLDVPYLRVDGVQAALTLAAALEASGL